MALTNEIEASDTSLIHIATKIPNAKVMSLHEQNNARFCVTILVSSIRVNTTTTSLIAYDATVPFTSFG